MERTYTIKYNARDLLSQLISSPFRKKKIHRVTSVPTNLLGSISAVFRVRAHFPEQRLVIEPTNLYASFICASRIYEL